MADRKPKFEIPVSESTRHVEYVEGEMMFDAPYAYHEEHPDASYEVWYYTIKDSRDGVEKTLAAYGGAYRAIEKTGYGQGAILSFGRIGSGKPTIWDIEYVSGPKAEATPAHIVQGPED